MPPPRQDDGKIRAPAFVCVVCVAVQVVVVARERWWLFYRQLCVSARTRPRPTTCGECVGRPCRLHPSARTQCCTLPSGSALRGNSWPHVTPVADSRMSRSLSCRKSLLCKWMSSLWGLRCMMTPKPAQQSLVIDLLACIWLICLWNAVPDNTSDGFQTYPVLPSTKSHSVGSHVNLKHHRERTVTCQITS